MNRSLNRNLYGGWYTHELLRELTLLNSYFIIYENKVKHLIKWKEYQNDETTNKTKWDILYDVKNQRGQLFMENIKNKKFTTSTFQVGENNTGEIAKHTSDSYLALGSILLAMSSNSSTAMQVAVTGAAMASATVTVTIPPIGIGLIALGYLAGKAIELTRNKTELLYVAQECAHIVQECFKIHCANAALIHVFFNDNAEKWEETEPKDLNIKLEIEKFEASLKDQKGFFRSGGRKTRRMRKQKKKNRTKSKAP
jgi:hypothetical protein